MIPATSALATAAPPLAPAKAATAAFHIPSLDGLRAISFFIVFLAHAGLEAVVPGGFGVTVFFFLSGYLITTLLRMELESKGEVSFRQFYLRRVLRILPPFYVVLAASTALTALGILHGELRLGAVMAQVLHYANYWIVGNGYSGQALGTGVYWSLAVEEHFYFLFPALYVLLRKLRFWPKQQAWVLFSLCAAVLAWRCALVLGFHSASDRTYVATDTRVDSILFGCALAVFRNPMLDAEAKAPSTLWRWLFGAGIAGLFFSFLYRDPIFRETWRYSLQGLCLYPVFMVAIRDPEWVFFRPMNWRWIAFLGTLSYSLYLVHHVILIALEHSLPNMHGVVRGLIGLTLSVGIAWALYHFVEKPCAKLRRKLSSLGGKAA